jgi:parallel beta-helix repeat protein
MLVMKKTALALTLTLALLISAVAGTVLVNLGTAAYVITTSPVNASSKTIVVPDEYPTIQAAIDAANAGDTVFVRKGTHDVFIGEYYNTEIFINKAISLIGEGRQETVIMGHYAHYTNVLITISADSVTISGFTMEGGLICGLSVLGSGCRITGNNVIGELEIFGENNVVTENNITGDRVYVFGSNNLISKNNVTGSLGAGIALATCQNVTVRDNNIINNGINYDPHFGGGLYLNGGPFYIYRNNITDNDNFGIELYWNCSNAYIFNNNIVGNKIGIWLPLMKKDIIGVGNKVYYNNFIDNDKNVVVEQANPYRNGASNGTDVVSWDNVLWAIIGATLMVRGITSLMKTTLIIIRLFNKLTFLQRRPLY